MVDYPEPPDFIKLYAWEDRNALIPAPVWVRAVEKTIAQYLEELEGKPVMMQVPPRDMGRLLEYILRLEMHITRLIQEQ